MKKTGKHAAGVSKGKHTAKTLRSSSRILIIAAAFVAALAIIISAVLLISAFNSSNSTTKNSVGPTIANKSSAKMATQPAKVLADNIPISATTLNRGDKVRIIEEDGDYVLVEILDSEKSESLIANGSGNARVYVNKAFVRSTEATNPDQRTGYASAAISIYSTAFLTGDSIADLEQNTPVTILDEFSNIAFIQLEDGTIGYASIYGFSEEPIEINDDYNAYPGNDYYGGGYYGYGYSDSESSGWTGGSIDISNGTSGTDGGTIDLSKVRFSSSEQTTTSNSFDLIPEAYADETYAVILTDGLPAYLGWYNRDQSIDVADLNATSSKTVTAIPESKRTVPESQLLVVVNNEWGYIPSYFVRLDSAEPFESWNGFTSKGIGLHSNPWLTGEIVTVCALNTSITILDDVGLSYFAQVGDTTGYISKEAVSKTEYEESEETAYDDDRYYYSYDYQYGYWDYDYNSGGATVDAGNTGPSSTVIESVTDGWTKEVL